MIRNVLGVIAGLITGGILFTVFQLINMLIMPKPEGFDYGDPSAMKQIVDSMPMYGWAILILGYAVGSFASGFVIGKIAESKTLIFPVIASILFMLGWLGNIMTIPHPVWVVVVVFLVYIPFAIAGHKLAAGKS